MAEVPSDLVPRMARGGSFLLAARLDDAGGRKVLELASKVPFSEMRGRSFLPVRGEPWMGALEVALGLMGRPKL